MADFFEKQIPQNQLTEDTNKVSTEDLLAEEKRKLEKFKENSPKLYESAKEEYDELALQFKSLKGDVLKDDSDLKEMKREFLLDLSGLKNIGQLEGVDNESIQNLMNILNNDGISEELEEEVYMIFKDKRLVKNFFDKGGKIPETPTEIQKFIDEIELYKNEEKDFSDFVKRIRKIKDFSTLKKIELEDILIKSEKHEKSGFNLQKIETQVIQFKSEIESRKEKQGDDVINSIKENVVENKNSEIENKNLMLENDNSEVKKAEIIAELLNKEIDIAKKRMKILLGIKNSLSGYEELSYLTSHFNGVEKPEKIDGEGDENFLKRLEKEINEAEKFFSQKDNLKPLFEKIREIDKKSGKTGKDSLYSKVYAQLEKVSPRVKQSLKQFIGEQKEGGEPFRNSSTDREVELAGIIAGNAGNIGDAVKLSEGRYLLGDKEFDFNDGEAKVSIINDDGYKIELGNIGENDLGVLSGIKGEIKESSRRLGNLQDELLVLEKELLGEQSKKPQDKEKIIQIEKKVEAKKIRIVKMQQSIEDLLLDKKSEERELSKFITKDKQKKVEKSMNIVNKTGFSILPQSFTDEFIARINLSPSLRTLLGFKRPIDLSEGILGFNDQASDLEKMIKFGEMVNGMISGDKTKPISLDSLRAGNSGYGENEAEVLMLINENLVVAGGYDVNKALSNLEESQLKDKKNKKL